MNLRNQISQRPWILAIAIAVIVVIWMYSGTDEQAGPTQTAAVASGNGSPDQLVAVQIASQYAEPITKEVKIYGQTAPAREVEINAETDGRVVAVEAMRGEQAKVGDIILRLDKRDREARLAQAKASVTEHRTSYQAQLELKTEGYVSETQIAETLAKLENAKAELIRAELDLEYMVVRAPFDGVLQDREVEIGDFVRTGDPVAMFVDNTSIIVTGTVAEQDAAYVKINDIGNASLATGQEVEGRIRYLSAVADPSTRTFNVELEVANPDGSLPAGVTAEIRLSGGQTMAQKVSPSMLSLNTGGDIGIKTVNELNQVEFHNVEVVASEIDGIWVTGMPDQARIITVGQGYVTPGQEVRAVVQKPDTALAETGASAEGPK
ncbi:MAG: efflux RND transporter periplasmic adaptor subunit [Gammaproteobacteria bacterium]|nr:efflux RND transporter periplasmic adaptor subunit [Gammaproteobacteria bacterium]